MTKLEFLNQITYLNNIKSLDELRIVNNFKKVVFKYENRDKIIKTSQGRMMLRLMKKKCKYREFQNLYIKFLLGTK